MVSDKSREKPELTVRVVLLGAALSVVMGAANVYLGLKVGMTVTASIPAAVIALVLFNSIFRGGTILEANQVQTAASAGEALAAGIIFTMPALLLIGAWQRFDPVMTTLVAFAGGLLGILFMIPMRRVFVVNNRELKFPEGVACAEVLKAGETSSEGNTSSKKSAAAIFWGAGLGGVFKILGSFLGMISGTLEGARYFSGRVFYFGADVSPALVAVGVIIGLNISLLVFIGGIIAWIVQLPLLSGGSDQAVPALDFAWQTWSTKVRYTGVGAMVVAGIASIYRVRSGLVHAVLELKNSTSHGAAKSVNLLDRDLPAKSILGFTLLAVVIIAGVYYSLTNSITITLLTTVIMVVMSFFFTAVASYIVGLVGNSNSPVSGMTISAVLLTGLLLLVFGFQGMEGMVATLGVAAVVCCAACTSGDVCNDLKTGELVGASPYRQQIMQIIGVAVASFVMAPILQLLHDYTPGGIGGRELAAPQAALFANLVRGFFGESVLPWNLVGVGAGIGVIVLMLDFWLEKNRSEFRLHLMPVAIGIYLPFGVSAPMVIGGLLVHFLGRNLKEGGVEQKPGVLFSSGVIAGESLIGVGIALLASFGINRIDVGLSEGWVELLTYLFSFVGIAFFFWSLKRKDI